MLIANGHIELAKVSGGGIDAESGYPKPVDTAWGDGIPCQFRAPKMDLRARTTDGSSLMEVSYEILVEWQGIGSERLRLYTVLGEFLGEFKIIRIMPLREVSKVKIWV